MVILKSKRNKNSLISFDRERVFRDDVIVLSKRSGHVLSKTTFNNPYRTYEAISEPVTNGTYKIKISSQDVTGNVSSETESTVVVDFYPLPPVNVSVQVVGNTVTLNWNHSIEGVPDNYYIYSNNGSGLVDKDTVFQILSGSLLTYSFVAVDGEWKFVIDTFDNGKKSDNLQIIDIVVPNENYIPPSPGPNTQVTQNPITGLSLERISVGKVKISFLWLYGNSASGFNIYHDDGTGVINYSIPKFTFDRSLDTLQIFTTTALHDEDILKIFKFVVRAKTSYGIEDKNVDEYEISVDGVAPSAPVDLSLDTIF